MVYLWSTSFNRTYLIQCSRSHQQDITKESSKSNFEGLLLHPTNQKNTEKFISTHVSPELKMPEPAINILRRISQIISFLQQYPLVLFHRWLFKERRSQIMSPLAHNTPEHSYGIASSQYRQWTRRWTTSKTSQPSCFNWKPTEAKWPTIVDNKNW